MPNYNHCTFIGNICKDIEMRRTASDMAVVNSTLAVNDHKRKDETLFIDFTVWGKTAEVFEQYHNKGDNVMLIGQLKYERWEGKDGQKRSKHALNVREFNFMDNRDKGVSESSDTSDADNQAKHDSTIPF